MSLLNGRTEQNQNNSLGSSFVHFRQFVDEFVEEPEFLH